MGHLHAWHLVPAKWPVGAAAICSIILILGCGGGIAPSLDATLAIANPSLPVGAVTTATATVTSGTAPAEGQTVTFSSADTSIATVTGPVTTDGSGRAVAQISAVAEGSTTITATVGSSTISASVTVTANEPESVTTITLTQEAERLVVGHSSTVTATVQIDGVNAQDAMVAFSSSPTNIITIAPTSGTTDADGNITVSFEAINPGDVCLSATSGDAQATAEVTVVAVGLADTAWPKYRGNKKNTGLSRHKAGRGSRIAWQTAIAGKAGDPVIGSDGTVYLGSSEWKVYALDGETGTIAWEFATLGPVLGAPAIAESGMLYVGSGDILYALDGATGSAIWEYECSGSVVGALTIADDGTVYVGTQSRRLYAIDGLTGSRLWEFATDDSVAGCPALGDDGTIYLGSAEGSLYAIWPNGKQRWVTAVGAAIESSPAIGTDGTVYIGSNGSRVLALDGATGKILWESMTKWEHCGSVGIGPYGTLYVTDGHVDIQLEPVRVCAISPNGSQRWVFEADSLLTARDPVIGSDGMVYIGSINRLYALDGATGAKRWEFLQEGFWNSSPAIGADGTIFMGGSGWVYALVP